MSVVLRCPTCGTSQGQVGECEACSEGAVQYFCTNHDEGIWLDSPVCNACGATFGDPPKKRAAPRTPGGLARPSGAPDYRPPVRRRDLERPSEPDFYRPVPPRRSAPEAAEPEVLPPAASLGELVEAMTARARARGRPEADEMPWLDSPVRRPGFPILGCLGRIVGLVFLLVALAVIFLFLLFAGVIVD